MAPRLASLLVTTALALGVTPALASSAAGPTGSPGAPGAGDPYFPRAGNGGYDVKHYGLKLRYRPGSDSLRGRAAIHAQAEKNLSRFNLDLRGMRVLGVRVDGRRATWSRRGGELRVTPARVLRKGHRFTAVIRYAGEPQTLPGGDGFIHTDDGALVIGQPEVAATWFPVNDHPSDKASYTFRVTVPRGLKAVANGELQRRVQHGRWTTWRWVAREPMAPYLATVDIGEWRLHRYKVGRIDMWDALDPDLFDAWAEPRTGERFAHSGRGDQGYKRLARTISVPEGGAELSFWVDRHIESAWEYFAVEAHTSGQDDWTTLPDENGHTSTDPGPVCAFLNELHPFLEHYQTPAEDGTCAPTGTTGEWHGATGDSADGGYEQWTVDLGAYAGEDVEVALTYLSDDVWAFPGVWVDDVTVSTGAGTTSFEDDAAPLDGWQAVGAPEGSIPNVTDWSATTPDANPAPLGRVIRGTFNQQGDILRFLAGRFGRYPFSAAGGIVDDLDGLNFALETQTRPVYDKGFFMGDDAGVAVVVHELAHQWYGDSVSVPKWRHIWLNEGFATYAEWLWSEAQGDGTAQEAFDFYLSVIPADDPFWELEIGDPGPDSLLAQPIYIRGAMTVHALRMAVGDDDFSAILRAWPTRNRNGWGTTRELKRLSERISGEELDELFRVWLFTPGMPVAPAAATPREPRHETGAFGLLSRRPVHGGD
jgi:hypothetical protein